MQINDETRSHMAKNGYVYWNDSKNHPRKNGLRQVCTDIAEIDFGKLIFDTDAYQAHIENGFIQAHDVN